MKPCMLLERLPSEPSSAGVRACALRVMHGPHGLGDSSEPKLELRHGPEGNSVPVRSLRPSNVRLQILARGPALQETY